MSNRRLAVRFFLQLAVVPKRFGQPQVVAEMVAGVLSGPSSFGGIAPG